MFYLFHRLRTLFWSAFYHSIGRSVFAELGKGARFEGWIEIPQRGGAIRIGRNARICRGVEFSVGRGAELEIGDGVFLGRGVVLSAHRRIAIGPRSLLAEYVCLHDNDHVTTDSEAPIGERGFSAEPLEIGADCWIGAHVVVVKGAALGNRCIVGAGGVVTHTIRDGALAVGVPAREAMPARRTDRDEERGSTGIA